MEITIYTIAYNEEVMLPFFIKWYRERFPDCKIVIYDNESTDNTIKIALENNCEIVTYKTGNKLSDLHYLEIKNNCWKEAKTDWVIVCDVDEMIDINADFLSKTEFTIIRGKGFQMCGEEGDSLESINKGIYDVGYSKAVCFNKKFIKDINYSPGCHSCNPSGNVLMGNEIVPLYHYKWINKEYVLNRYKLFNERLSDTNKKNRWGVQYTFPEKVNSDYYESLLKNRIELFKIE